MTEAIDVQDNQEEIKRKEILAKVLAELKKVREYTPKVGIFGDSGVGKSSLCNALFGKQIAKISDVEACTREPQEILLGEENKGGIILVDVPGVGEDPKRHEEYIALYKSLAPKLDLVLWAIKADDRKYLSSMSVYTEILEPNIKVCPVVFVITQTDKIEPLREWDLENHKPSAKQEANLTIKINDISSRFNISTNKIIAVCSDDSRGSYNLVELVNKVIEVLPNEKKFSFAREAKEENVSEEAARSAEKGVLDHLAEIAGKVWDTIKVVVVTAAVETVKTHGKKFAKDAIKWLKSFF